MSASCQLSCDYRGTPLRLVNANLGILYLALAAATLSIYFYLGTGTVATYDKNLYNLRNIYSATGGTIMGTAAPSSTVTINTACVLILFTMLFVTNMLFHFGYALDYKRAYTIMLIDRCNKLRWIQFAIVNTLLALYVAQISGTNSFDFFLAALFFLPVGGILGFLMDKYYPCFPGLFWIAYLGLFLAIGVAYWSPVITNLAIHWMDSNGTMLPYIFVAGASLMVFHLLIVLLSYIQTRTKIRYPTIEIIHSFLMFALCTAMIGSFAWAVVG